ETQLAQYESNYVAPVAGAPYASSAGPMPVIWVRVPIVRERAAQPAAESGDAATKEQRTDLGVDRACKARWSRASSGRSRAAAEVARRDSCVRSLRRTVAARAVEPERGDMQVHAAGNPEPAGPGHPAICRPR